MTWRVVLLLALIAAIGCATARPPGVFSDAGPFHGNTLNLEPDGTFTYEAWSDDGGAYWRAEGTWRWEDDSHFVTQVTNVTLGSDRVDAALDRYQVWRVTSSGVVRDTPTFRPRRIDV